MQIIVQTDDGSVQEAIARVEDFDFKDPSGRATLMNEVRDAVSRVNARVNQKLKPLGIKMVG